jgi:hypothetical protein
MLLDDEPMPLDSKLMAPEDGMPPNLQDKLIFELQQSLKGLTGLFRPHPAGDPRAITHERTPYAPTSPVALPDPTVPDIEDIPWDTGIFFSPRFRPASPSVGSIVSVFDADIPSPSLRSVKSDEDRDFYANLLDDHDLPDFELDEEREKERDRPSGDREEPNHGEGEEHEHDRNHPDYNQEQEPEEEPEGEPEGEPEEVDERRRFDPFMNDMDPEPEDDPGEPDEYPCGAFDDDPPDFRNFFIRTYLQSAFKGVTNDSIADILATHRDCLAALESRGELSEPLRARLPFFPLSLRALERRLGMDVNNIIKIYSLCPSCGVRRDMEFIDNAVNSACPRIVNDDICGGILYTESILYGGKRKRTPTRSFPYVSLRDSLERQLLRPGFAEALQLWRREGDEAGEFPPERRQTWMNETDMDISIGKPWDSWAWRGYPVGVTRAFDEETARYGDKRTGQFKSLIRLPLGISLSINIDG